jgi:CDGSH-type Zn-finger protein
MNEPVPSCRTPFARPLKAGETCWWCACGRSRAQPFCDGSHAGTTSRPVKYTAARDEWVWFCGCKRSATPPICDGTHQRAP